MLNLDPYSAFGFILIYCSIPPLGYVMLRMAGIQLFRVCIPSTFFAYYLLVSYIGLLPLYFGWSDYTVEIGVVDANRVFILLLYNAASILLVTLGFVVASKVFGSCGISKGPITPLDNKAIIAVVFVVLVSLAVNLEYLRQVPGLAIVAAFSDNKAAQLLHSQMTNDFAGPFPYHYYSLFFTLILPFSIFIIFDQSLTIKTANY